MLARDVIHIRYLSVLRFKKITVIGLHSVCHFWVLGHLKPEKEDVKFAISGKRASKDVQASVCTKHLPLSNAHSLNGGNIQSSEYFATLLLEAGT